MKVVMSNYARTEVILAQFTSYLCKYKLLSSHQSGNHKFHSTETINHVVTDSLFEALDAKEISMLILLDLSKAFESVDHNILLPKNSRLGSFPLVYSWFASYQSNRSQ